MNYDYDGNFDELQQKLTDKGITIDQLDIKDYAGLTKKELDYIIDNAEYYIKKSSADRMQMLYNFKAIKRPDNCNDDDFITILKNTEFYDEIDASNWVYSTPTGYLWIWEELQKVNIDEYIDIYKHVMKEYDNRTDTVIINGTGKFDDNRYSGGRKYQIFAGIAELYISKTYMNNEVFRRMLYEEYIKHFS